MGVNDTIYDTIGKHCKIGVVIQAGKYKMAGVYWSRRSDLNR